MNNEFINLTEKNLANEHLCCIIRAKEHPGIEAKRKWISGRLSEGHVFRKLDIKGCASIEYAPLEKAWVPITGDNFYYIYCLWVQGAPRGCGYGHKLMEYCIKDAKKHGMSGICMLGAKKNRKTGFQTKNLQRNSDLKQQTKPQTVTVCWLFPLTARNRNSLHRSHRKSTERSLRFIMIFSVRTFFKGLKSLKSIVRIKISRQILYWLILLKKQKNCRACLTTGQYFTVANL